MSVVGLRETIEWYDKNAETYASASADYFDLNHVQAFSDLVPRSAKVLDAGCGPGRDAAILKAHCGLEVVGVDISKGLLDVARHKHPGIHFIEGDLLNLPFDNEIFDGVWSNTSILHLETIEDVRTALTEMNRVLKNGGVLHLVVKAQIDDNKTAVVSDKLSGHDRFFQYFDHKELIGLMQDARFKIISTKEYSETDTIPHGRPEVRLIWCLARKT